MSQQINRAAKILEELNTAATESMPPFEAMAKMDDEKQRWVAERNRRLDNLVQVYSAHRISDAIDGLSSDLESIQRAVEHLPQA